MGYVISFPFGQKHKVPRLVTTTNKITEQIWQELVMLRYLKAHQSLASPKLTAPWIDQAMTYYLDASHSNWRSAGLLYYYSFLNLAKALLAGKKRFSYRSLTTISTL
ncbi:MAG: YaaC family protein, partial [Anaerolineales bacterium]